MATVNKRTNAIVAHLPGVKKAVRGKAEEIGGRARTFLAAHRVTGEHHIEVTSGKVDSFMSLVGPAAISVEFGHGAYTDKHGRKVGASQGLYIVTRAAGLS